MNCFSSDAKSPETHSNILNYWKNVDMNLSGKAQFRSHLPLKSGIYHLSDQSKVIYIGVLTTVLGQLSKLLRQLLTTSSDFFHPFFQVPT